MISLPKKPKIVTKKENWARFEIEALYPGYGTTTGNSLRRVLLSSLSGAAVTQIKIKNIPHEFSTIKGALEDVLMITMNIKQMRFKMFSPEPQRATLKVKGEKQVKGSDFKYPSQIELVNNSCHIAFLTDKKAELDIEIQIEKGIGYEPVERRKKQAKTEIGVIPIDAIFTPVRKTSFRIENMRVGERTDFDRLYLDIETDGTITPEQAFSQASEILVKHFSLFSEITSKPSSEKKEKAVKKKKEEEEEETEEELTKIKIEELKLSLRTINVLLNQGIKTLAGILKRTEPQLLELEGMGEKGVKEIKKALKKLELELKQG